MFYALDEVSAETAADNGYEKAYLDTENTTTTTTTTTETNGAGSGTAFLENAITNTKISSLPSTGGMGTTLFTIAGCVIMISAAGLFFATRKKAN